MRLNVMIFPAFNYLNSTLQRNKLDETFCIHLVISSLQRNSKCTQHNSFLIVVDVEYYERSRSWCISYTVNQLFSTYNRWVLFLVFISGIYSLKKVSQYWSIIALLHGLDVSLKVFGNRKKDAHSKKARGQFLLF